MSIQASCVNTNCSQYQAICEMSPLLELGEGELVYCGECGSPTEFLTGAELVKRKPFSVGMNIIGPRIPFNRGELPDV